ncbi:MAG: sodium:solute symporter, partial [Clostridia bacterium]|nr:sodium:solute symporter [Clostridia bacterium]
MLLGAVNSNRIIAYAILGVYVLMMVGITIYSRKKSKSLNDFLFAGKGLGGWVTALAYGTTYFSAVVFIGYAGKFGWGFGIAALWIGVGNALIGSLLAWKVFARRTRNMTKGLGVKTMPELFEKRYQSKNIRLVSSIVMFIFLIPYSASVYQGLAYVFEAVFGIEYVFCILIMAGLTALYLFFGGYFASSMSNFVQAIIMFVGVIVMMILIMNKGGWGDAITRLT